MIELSTTRRNLIAGMAAAAALPMLYVLNSRANAATAKAAHKFEINLTPAQWHARLSGEAFYVLRQAGTERPYSSALNDEHRAGRFICAGCDLPLFSSKTKFNSGTGWPSFWQPLTNAVISDSDTTLGMARTEILCRRCGGHLGHVFDDGPAPTGLRYCMNGVAMKFVTA